MLTVGLSVVWLVITCVDADTGDRLWKLEEQRSDFSVSGNRIEDCRQDGITRAKRVTEYFRAHGHPNATTNVDCEWRPGKPSNPA